MEGTFILSNKKEHLDTDPPELALGETSGSPKEATTDYIHLLSDVFYPKYNDTQAAAICSFIAVMKQHGISGNMYCKLIPEDGVPVNDNPIVIAPDDKFNVN